MDKNSIKQIPLELVSVILNNHNNQKLAMSKCPVVYTRQNTKDVLYSIKKQNRLTSLSAAIDLLIATVSMYQMNDVDNLGDVLLYDKDLKMDLKVNKGVTRSVVVNGREFYSLATCARTYKVSKQTVINRINDLDNYKWRNWNYSDEDLKLKYDDRRVRDK